MPLMYPLDVISAKHWESYRDSFALKLDDEPLVNAEEVNKGLLAFTKYFGEETTEVQGLTLLTIPAGLSLYKLYKIAKENSLDTLSVDYDFEKCEALKESVQKSYRVLIPNSALHSESVGLMRMTVLRGGMIAEASQPIEVMAHFIMSYIHLKRWVYSMDPERVSTDKTYFIETQVQNLQFVIGGQEGEGGNCHLWVDEENRGYYNTAYSIRLMLK